MESPTVLNPISKSQFLNLIKERTPSQIQTIILRGLGNRFIALWACHYGFDELVSLKIPPPPYSLIQWRALSDKEKLYNPYDWGCMEAMGYLEAKGKNKLHNKNSLEWLEKIKHWLDLKEDQEELVMVTNRIYDFNKGV